MIKPRATSQSRLATLVDRYGDVDASIKALEDELKVLRAELLETAIVKRLDKDEGAVLNGNRHSIDVSVKIIQKKTDARGTYNSLPLEVFLSICTVPVTGLETVLKTQPDLLARLVTKQVTETRKLRVLR